jgi:hypothetical protein
MGKLIFWIVVVFAILFLLRLWNARKARTRSGDSTAGKAGKKTPELMVRCEQCGVFLPQADARVTTGGYRCADPKCTVRPPGSNAR